MELSIFSDRETCLMTDNIVVKQSSVHGLGAFAAKNISAQRVVGYYKGSLWKGGDDTYTHCWVGEDGTEVDINVEGPLRYMNHDGEPNCDIQREDLDPMGNQRSVIISICNIDKGQELTRYYSDYFHSLLTSVSES